MIIKLLTIACLSMASKEFIRECDTEKPNCVSSFDERENHQIEPLEVWDKDWTEIKEIILEAAKKETAVQKAADLDSEVFHIVAVTRFFRFKDDLYFWFDERTRNLHFKSKSRVGYSDLGKNRSRLEAIKTQILKKLPSEN